MAGPITGLKVKDFFFPLQKAIYQRLAGDNITYTDTTQDPPRTGVAVPIYDKPPKDQLFPSVLAGEVSASQPNNTKLRAGQDIIYTVHVESDYQGLQEAAQIANQVAISISRLKLDLVDDGLNVVVSKLQGIQARQLGDGRTMDYTVQFFFMIVEDPAQLP